MIVPGTIVVFDDFINYHGWEEGEFKAFMEFVTARQLAFEYVAYNRTGAGRGPHPRSRSRYRDRALSGWRSPTAGVYVRACAKSMTKVLTLALAAVLAMATLDAAAARTRNSAVTRPQLTESVFSRTLVPVENGIRHHARL